MKTTSCITRREGGYALITALIFFLAGGSALVGGLSSGVVREVKTIRTESLSKQGYFTSESALEDALYRVVTGKQVSATETLTIGSSTASVSVTDIGNGLQKISSAADTNSTHRNTEATIETGNTIDFSYAIQAGVGGVDLSGGTGITGDIYTSGSVRASGTASVSGLVTAAEVASITLDQDNSLPATPTQNISFGNTASTQDFAQGFRVPVTTSLMKISLFVKKVGNPANATIKITASQGSNPNFYNPIASGTLSSSFVSTSYGWIDITLTTNPVLSPGTTYWIVIDTNYNASSYYMIAGNSSYANGQAKVGNGNSWSNMTPTDGYFKTYAGTSRVGVSGVDQWNRLSVGSAYANQVSFVNATGAIYCQIGGSNNKACDTSRADPVVENLPVPDATIALWKDEAVAGGTVGNQVIGPASVTLGPKKITGSLIVSSGGQLNVAGTLWVTGNVTINGGSTVRSADSSKSFTIIADGLITLSGGARVTGSAGSHILLVSLNSSDNAVIIDGGANDTLLFAPNGGVFVSGGANVKTVAARKVSLSGGSQVTYDPEMSIFELSSGSSGGTLNIKSWKEVE